MLYRGGAEQKIRKYLIDNNYVDAVIQLPPDLFFGTTIATCILVLKKSKKDNSVLFIDATAEFGPPWQQEQAHRGQPAEDPRRLRGPRGRRPLRQAGPEQLSIAENGYNLIVSSYVEGEGHERSQWTSRR